MAGSKTRNAFPQGESILPKRVVIQMVASKARNAFPRSRVWHTHTHMGLTQAHRQSYPSASVIERAAGKARNALSDANACKHRMGATQGMGQSYPSALSFRW